MMNERELTDLWTSYTKLVDKINRGAGLQQMMEEL
jgi:hypothetical protein